MVIRATLFVLPEWSDWWTWDFSVRHTLVSYLPPASWCVTAPAVVKHCYNHFHRVDHSCDSKGLPYVPFNIIWVNCCWSLPYSVILCPWADSLHSCRRFFWSAVNIHPIGVCTVVFSCCIAGPMWCCCHLGTCSVCTIQICTSLQCYFMQHHILECMCV